MLTHSPTHPVTSMGGTCCIQHIPASNEHKNVPVFYTPDNDLGTRHNAFMMVTAATLYLLFSVAFFSFSTYIQTALHKLNTQ